MAVTPASPSCAASPTSHYLTPTLLIVTVKPTEAGLGITLKETDPGLHGSQVGPNPGYVREDIPKLVLQEGYRTVPRQLYSTVRYLKYHGTVQ